MKGIERKKAFHAIGIDISDGSLELVDVREHRDGTLAIHDYTRTLLPGDAIVHGIIKKEQVLTESLLSSLKTLRMKPDELQVVTALPDSQIIVKTLPLAGIAQDRSYENLEHLAHHLYHQLDYHINKPLIQWQYNEMKKRGVEELVVYMTSKSYVDQWRAFFLKHRMRLAILEMESLALSRALIERCAFDEKVAIIDLGFRSTSLSLIEHCGLRYSYSIPEGGWSITLAIAHTVGCSLDDAERIKLAATKSAEVSDIIMKTMEKILHSLAEHVPLDARPVSRIILTGGGAQTRGTKELVERRLGSSASLGEVWLHPMRQKNIQLKHPRLAAWEQQLYAGAIGLAIRGSSRSHQRRGINFIQ